MVIRGVDAYKDPYINGNSSVNKAATGAERINGNSNSGEMKIADPENIVTKNERDFFIKLFPDNSDQISRHVLFNRNGRLQSPEINKGMIVDGRV